MEHVRDTHRLALMNLMLHGIDSDPEAGGIRYGDTLGPDGQALGQLGATLVLTDPPFGTKKGGGLPTRDDFTCPTSNKQFCSLQHTYRTLKPGGRAAVVLPDNVLFESNVGTGIRRDLMDKCNLHTILRLPTGIFYAPCAKTNVLFFTRAPRDVATGVHATAGGAGAQTELRLIRLAVRTTSLCDRGVLAPRGSEIDCARASQG